MNLEHGRWENPVIDFLQFADGCRVGAYDLEFSILNFLTGELPCQVLACKRDT